MDNHGGGREYRERIWTSTNRGTNVGHEYMNMDTNAPDRRGCMQALHSVE